MKTIFAVGVTILATGCWMDEFEAATSQNEQALDAYERGDLVDTYAEAVSGQAEAQQAVEAYYADHGRFPRSLQELVPNYLQTVPRQQDGTPFTYNPETGVVSN